LETSENRDGREGGAGVQVWSDLVGAFHQAVESVDGRTLVRRWVEKHAEKVAEFLRDRDSIYLVALGKAAVSMAAGFLDTVENSCSGGHKIRGIQGGIVAAPHYALGGRSKRDCGERGAENVLERYGIEITGCGHPMPDEESFKCGKKVLDLAKRAGEGDGAVVLLSGGGSAVCALPVPPISPSKKRGLVEKLWTSGATIGEINTVRRHVSLIKGGKLARAFFPAESLCLVLSDVPDNNPPDIASGPMSPDPTTCRDAVEVLERYGLAEKVGENVLGVLRRGRGETVKPDSPIWKNVEWHLVGDNSTAVRAAGDFLRKRRYHVEETSGVVGDAGGVTQRLIEQIRKRGGGTQKSSEKVAAGSVAVVWGGETTVRVPKNSGLGGRNQHMALVALRELLFGSHASGTHTTGVHDTGRPNKNAGFLFASTDGVDGNTDVAGVVLSSDFIWFCKHEVADGRLSAEKIDQYLAGFDSHRFFETMEKEWAQQESARRSVLIRTGPTMTNVCDLYIAAFR